MGYKLLILRKILIYIGAIWLGVSATASAQIYSWRDASGNLVLSNKPRPGARLVRSYAVPRTELVRATRFVPAERTRRYDDVIRAHAVLNGVRADLVRAVVQVESAFNPSARSPKGALGLMQLMPATIEQFGVRNPFSPTENIGAGVAYLRQLLDRYENNEELALAAYNAGPGAVDKHGQNVPPYRETRNYVAQVNQAAGRATQVQAPVSRIYRSVEIINGREVVRYSDKKPAIAASEMLSTR